MREKITKYPLGKCPMDGFGSRTISIGNQNFGDLIEKHCFYVDKTAFIKEWWENEDAVTLITRPRRFGKTLTMSMVEQFFSVKYADKGKWFEGLSVWNEEKYRKLQGTYPVISLSFANVKEKTYQQTKQRIGQLITELYNKNDFLLDTDLLNEEERQYYKSIRMDMPEVVATLALYKMSDFLARYYQKGVIILLDEYDTPMQEAYVDGYCEELVSFTRSMFSATFKTNPYLERAIMTGITRVSKESVFSDLNHLEIVTTTSCKYEECFGFTESEVFAAMDEYGYADKQIVKRWYDGFAFGEKKDIYNPWSILNYLDKGKIDLYWANTSSNSLVSKLIREGTRSVKQPFEDLLAGGTLNVSIDEQIVYSQLDGNTKAVWSLLLASGYLCVVSHQDYSELSENQSPVYELALTNREVQMMFQTMVSDWFSQAEDDYNDFVKALLQGDVEAMNAYMNQVALATFSSFDSGKKSSEKVNPEKFFHGFVLGLLVELREKYILTSNRESGYGRYDVMLEPRRKDTDAIILEFKVQNQQKEKSLEDAVKAALAQIEEKQYESNLVERGIPKEKIRKYGFAFAGKRVLIG